MPMPQLDPSRPVTSANYWIEAVTKKAASQDYAWDFLRFAADPAQAKTLATTSGRTPAIRTLVDEIVASETDVAGAKVFAQQAATASGWFSGIDPEQGRKALNELVDDVASGKATAADAFTRAAQLFTLALGSKK